MKKRFVVSTLILITLLTSCNTRTLRSDLAKFVASFSLETSLLEYKHAKYEKVATVNSGDNTTVITETFTFDVTDPDNLLYKKENIVTENGEEITHTEDYTVKNDANYTYHKSDGTIVTISTEECRELIKKFFYTTSEIDETYHEGGMFYGDYIRISAIEYQNYDSIDENNQLYIRQLNLKDVSQQGQTVNLTDKFFVNSIGMLVSRDMVMENDETKLHQTITAYKL